MTYEETWVFLFRLSLRNIPLAHIFRILSKDDVNSIWKLYTKQSQEVVKKERPAIDLFLTFLVYLTMRQKLSNN